MFIPPVMSNSWLTIIERCNVELHWGLDQAARERYARALAYVADPETSAAQARVIAVNYHADHQQVLLLRDAHHPAHDGAWQAWAGQVLAVLRSADLAWSSDGAIDVEDLAQIGRAELARALPTFRYHSRFSSWAYRVVVQALHRHVRDSQASKRAIRPDSLDQLIASAQLPATDERPEQHAEARDLQRLVWQVLGSQQDKRLASMFELSALNDKRASEIGALMQLSPSRVRALLQHCRSLLQADPSIRAWIEEAC
jgi:RNA polymerase sigma factor (sigma-70 family)